MIWTCFAVTWPGHLAVIKSTMNFSVHQSIQSIHSNMRHLPDSLAENGSSGQWSNWTAAHLQQNGKTQGDAMAQTKSRPQLNWNAVAGPLESWTWRRPVKMSFFHMTLLSILWLNFTLLKKIPASTKLDISNRFIFLFYSWDAGIIVRMFLYACLDRLGVWWDYRLGAHCDDSHPSPVYKDCPLATTLLCGSPHSVWVTAYVLCIPQPSQLALITPLNGFLYQRLGNVSVSLRWSSVFITIHTLSPADKRWKGLQTDGGRERKRWVYVTLTHSTYKLYLWKSCMIFNTS